MPLQTVVPVITIMFYEIFLCNVFYDVGVYSAVCVWLHESFDTFTGCF